MRRSLRRVHFLAGGGKNRHLFLRGGWDNTRHQADPRGGKGGYREFKQSHAIHLFLSLPCYARYSSEYIAARLLTSGVFSDVEGASGRNAG
jgi:hypothetical protein